MSKEDLYILIEKATQNGNNAEVKRDKDGDFVVYSVKKQKQKQLVK